jgi:hypothetical protein
MPKAGLEPAITASERSVTVHVSDPSATATGNITLTDQLSNPKFVTLNFTPIFFYNYEIILLLNFAA